jgi:hypothetical protein
VGESFPKVHIWLREVYVSGGHGTCGSIPRAMEEDGIFGPFFLCTTSLHCGGDGSMTSLSNRDNMDLEDFRLRRWVVDRWCGIYFEDCVGYGHSSFKDLFKRRK